MRGVIAVMVLATIGPWATAGPLDEVPEAFAPFEHMVGGWKGTASPVVNRVKGWQETHGWAWKFEKGVPIGMSLTFEGDKVLAKAQLGYDRAARKYHLDGTDPEGKPVAFVGALSADGKALTLDRVGTTPDGKERLIVRPNSNKIRYTLQLDRQAAGSPQYKSVISVGLTKEGESFAAGGAESNLPKCILTGGAASMTVSYLGKTFPVCCSGCRDEFNENPEKYAKTAEAMTRAEPDASPDKPAPPATAPSAAKDEAKPDASKAKGKAARRPEVAKTKDDPESKAGRELSLGQNFEKNGKNDLALNHFRKVVKDYPATEAAKEAAARIKALDPR